MHGTSSTRTAATTQCQQRINYWQAVLGAVAQWEKAEKAEAAVLATHAPEGLASAIRGR